MLGDNVVTSYHGSLGSDTQTRPHWSLLVTMLVLLVSAGCGAQESVVDDQARAASPATLGQESGAAIQADFLHVRPGDRLVAFLGRSMAPSHWTPVVEAAQTAIDDCIVKVGGTPRPRPPLKYPAFLELQGTNLAAFRDAFGYGVVENARAQTETPSGPDPANEMSIELDQMYNSCEGAGQNFYVRAAAPQQVVERYNELLSSHADDGAYVAASSKWEACMADAGFDLTGIYGAYFAKGVVERLLFAAQDKARPVGSRVDFEALQFAEGKAFNADAACLASSGVGEVMLDLEGQILESLRSEFPNYTPPAGDPANRDWQT